MAAFCYLGQRIWRYLLLKLMEECTYAMIIIFQVYFLRKFSNDWLVILMCFLRKVARRHLQRISQSNSLDVWGDYWCGTAATG